MNGSQPNRRHYSSLRGRLLFLICLATLPAILFTFFVAERERAAALADGTRCVTSGQSEPRHAHQIGRASCSPARRNSHEGQRSPIIRTRASCRRSWQAIQLLLPMEIGQAPIRFRAIGAGRQPAFLEALRSNDVVADVSDPPIFDRPT